MAAMTPIEIMSRCTPVPLPHFGEYFSNFKQSAFRLECLPQYRVESERDAVDNFKAGKARPADFNSDWVQILTDARSRKAKIGRVRLLPQRPTDYIHFEYEWGYRQHADLGEEIRVIDPRNLGQLSGFSLMLDYWLFDSSSGFLMIYDYTGQFMGVMKSDAAVSELLHTQSRQLLAASSDLSFLSEYLRGLD
jgi:hypothetical protein